jgi:hypothetical protein
MSDDTTVRCTTCGRVEVVNMGHCLVHGWPVCHGQTMRLGAVSKPIDESVGEALRAQGFRSPHGPPRARR